MVKRVSLSTLVAAAAALSATSVSAAVSTVVVTRTLTTCTAKASSYSATPSSSSTASAPPPYPSGNGSSGAGTCDGFFLEQMKHQGIAPYAPSGYQVFRDVTAFGAKGDGVTDDADAINKAITSLSSASPNDDVRCAPGSCNSTTTTPGYVYFPPGTYLISKPIIDYYYTFLIGNPNCMPVIKTSSNYSSAFVIDGDEYQSTGNLGWLSTNVFFRQIANLIIDMTASASNLTVAGIHWPTGQATSIQNVVFKMSQAADTKHQGLFIESGSGGYVGDLVFYGGAQGLLVGNQQFTMRNLTFYNAVTAVKQLWDWGWTYQGISINNCSVGFDITAVDKDASKQDALQVGGVVILDSVITNTPIGVTYGNSSVHIPAVPNNIILENIQLNNVAVAVKSPSGTALEGTSGSSTIAAWGRGNSYTPSSTSNTSFEGPFNAIPRPAGLTQTGGAYYTRSKPSYADVPVSSFVSARSAGAVGDANADDTDALNKLFASAAAANQIVFLDAGMYKVTGTIKIPAGSRIWGEGLPVILSSGSYFADMANPKPVVQVGQAGDVGVVEWSNAIVSTKGAQAGAILIEWNLASSPITPSGLWEVHTRVGGFAGSDLQLAQCPTTQNYTVTSSNLRTECIAAFMSMHITKSASGLYMENTWFWVADHDIEDEFVTQITIYAGRGLLVESVQGSIWMVGTAVEHHQMYEYQLVNTRDVMMGQIQTETAYYQSNPDASIPFPTDANYHDPVFPTGEDGWGVRIVGSQSVLVYGAGLYSFFENQSTNCSAIGNGEACQKHIFSIENSRAVSVYNLNTVGTTFLYYVDGVDLAYYGENVNGFVDSVALFQIQ